jgi:hypothetical protein
VLQNTKAEVLVLSGLDTGTLAAAPLAIPSNTWGNYVSSLVASGKRALVATGWQGALSIVDATTATPSIVRTVDIVGYPSQIMMSGSKAIVSLGMDGVMVIDLAQ